VTPYLIAITVFCVAALYAYARFVRREELRHLTEERDSEKRHAADWKEMAVVLADGALAMREVPTVEEAREHAALLHKTDSDREPTLEELEAEMDELSNPLRVSMDGELGRRRELALKIKRMKDDRDDGMAEPAEELPESFVNTLDDDDKAHLNAN
jgi:hypothetical protein